MLHSWSLLKAKQKPFNQTVKAIGEMGRQKQFSNPPIALKEGAFALLHE